MSVGRTAQQNWILKVNDNRVWGLVCGPCTPAVVAMIDEGRIDGDTITFYINHIDTPPDASRQGIQRNVMTGKISGSPNANVMRFTWVREQLPHSERRDRDDRTDQGTLNSPGAGGVIRRSVGGISCGIHPYGIR